MADARAPAPDAPASLAERVAALRWYHTIDLGHGVVTPGVDDTRERLARLALPGSLAGKTVLDIGAWDGFFSFEAERRGAARVVASDSYSWKGGGWGTKSGFLLAREALGSRVEDVEKVHLRLDDQQLARQPRHLIQGQQRMPQVIEHAEKQHHVERPDPLRGRRRRLAGRSQPGPPRFP